MEKFFESTISYLKQQANGTMKRSAKQYLVEASTFTEAEAAITKHIGQFVRSDAELKVEALKRSNIYEAIPNPEGPDLWYRVRVNIVTLNEFTGKETKTPYCFLVQAETTDEASQIVARKFKDNLTDWTIAAIAETKILEVYYSPTR